MFKDVDKSEDVVIRVEVKTYRDHTYLDIRTMHRNDQDDLMYTKKGITLGLDQVDELLEAVKTVIGAVKK